MKKFKGIYLGKQYFSKEWIVQNFQNLDTKIFPPYQFKTLQFCGQWLTGQQTFTVQTSGTTGPSKPVQLLRRQLIASAQLTGQVLNLSQGDRALVCLSPDYIAGLMMLVRGMELGLEMIAVEPQSNPFAEFSFEEEIHFDFTAMVPLQIQTIFDSFPQGIVILNLMKTILLGGAPISEELKNSIQNIEAPVYHTFGMTETASHVALRRLNGSGATEKYYPLPGIKIGTDERGCLWIKGVITDYKMITTNDLVELDSDGGFVWLGRLDNVINTGGIKVPAEKIEQKLNEILHQLHIQRNCLVSGLPDRRLGEKIVAVFEGEPLPKEVLSKIKNKLVTKLNKYEMPKQFYFLKKFVRTTTGKIDRKGTLQMIRINSNKT